MKTGQIKLRPEDRQSLEDKRSFLISEIKGIPEGRGEETLISMNHLMESQDQMGQEVKRLTHLIDLDASLEARNKIQRARLDKRRRELEDRISNNFPSWRDQMVTVKSSGILAYEQSVQKSMYFMKNFTNDVLEWKKIKNMLEPQDPTADNIYHALKTEGGYLGEI